MSEYEEEKRDFESVEDFYYSEETEETPQIDEEAEEYEIEEQLMPKLEAEKKPSVFGKVMKKACAIVVSGLLFGAVAAGGIYGTNALIKHLDGSDKKVESTEKTDKDDKDKVSLTHKGDKEIPTISADATTIGDNLTVAQIVENCMPSIVAITNLGVSDVTTFWGTYQQESQSAGSGIIIGQTDTELIILTNNHVVEGSKELTVVFSFDESSEKPDAVEAHIKGCDASKDLGVIAINLEDLNDDIMKEIKVAVIGDSKALHLGDQVVAIGNALGYGQSVTTGIVSALDRSLEISQNNTKNKYIQTDAAINPGNSGGALLNMNGELIGINSAKVSSSSVEGMGYAIPISDVSDIIDGLMNMETKIPLSDEETGYLCISGQTVDNASVTLYNVPAGVVISEAYEGYAADKAGIQKGDIITNINGTDIKSMEDLKAELSYCKAGEKVEITYVRYDNKARAYKEYSTTVTLNTYEEFQKITSKK